MDELHFSAPEASDAPIPPEFLELAPLDLPNVRANRYQADDQSIRLGTLETRDRDLIRTLYTRLDDLLGRLSNNQTTDEQKLQDVLIWLEHHVIDDLVEEAHQLGRESLAATASNASTATAKAMHDVRGGALTSLLACLQMLPYAKPGEEGLSNLFRLARDQMKIMRSAITGLDDVRHEIDRLPRAHDVKLMLGKWHDVVVGPHLGEQEKTVRMYVDCRHEGALTECCLESAAIDRIFHNLTSNACRYVVNGRIDLLVFHVPDAQGATLRFVLSNEVDAAQIERLRTMAEGSPEKDLRGLFGAGVSSTGSGYGMAVIADFVAGAFGVATPSAAVARGYTGACLHGSTFRVWFHWPVAQDDLQTKGDDLHDQT